MPAPAACDLETLILARSDVASLAAPEDWLAAAESAFRGLAEGSLRTFVSHVPAQQGGFHIKSASSDAPPQVAIKVNGNFPGNPARYGLPTIRGVVMLSDARDGRLLALIDSIELTARRTAAASALAARLLARRDATRLAFIGAGVQAICHLEAMLALDGFAFRHVACHDQDPARAEQLCAAAAARGMVARRSPSARDAVCDAEVIVTCTPARQALLDRGDIAPGAFIAAVGADHGDKQELAPGLLAAARVVTDLTIQAASMGDLHHALAAGALTLADVHAELADVVVARRPGRIDPQEIFVFDSTGVAACDLTAASMLHARAQVRGLRGRRLDE